MSLLRQIWLAVVISGVVAFSGSFVVAMLMARSYFAQELLVKNIDNANALALALGQAGKDAIERELLIAAQFDTGHYESIRLRSPGGKVLVEKTTDAAAEQAPAWFVRLFPLDAAPGVAQVSAGWEQVGELQVSTSARHAYAALWRGALQLALWFLVAVLFAGMVGGALVRRVMRPLEAVTAQAQAIGERRFVTIEAPRIPELQRVAHAMNAMVERLQAMFREEAARLDALRREANIDALTGLANRAHFLAQIDRGLAGEDLPDHGVLALLRVADLAQLNQRYGREEVDRLLGNIGTALAALVAELPDAQAGRLSGADFAVLAPGAQEPAELAVRLLSLAHDAALAPGFEPRQLCHAGLAQYAKGVDRQTLMALADAALASAETGVGLPWHAAPASMKPVPPMGQWRALLVEALEQDRIALATFPVVGADGTLLHLERPLRVQLAGSAEWLPAGSVLPAAIRLGLSGALDLAVLRHALDALDDDREHDLAVNLAGESISDPRFRSEATALLAAAPAKARRLWLEVSEHGALAYWNDFLAWCDGLRHTGCRLGLEHFGRQLARLDRLQGIGLDYLKVDSVLIEGLDVHPGNEAFLRGTCNIARTLGLLAIAEGVRSRDELARLIEMGFTGATGTGVTMPESGKGIAP